MISIIVPAFNAEKTIANCIESILAQEFEEAFELIVVDDESTDNTRGTVKQFTQVVLAEQKHAGPAVARNNGAKKARGAIIIFVDSDCIASGDWLREMVAPFKGNSVAAVQGAYRTKQKSLVARFAQIEIEERYERMKKAQHLDWVGSYAAAFRKSVFLEFNGFDESFPIASGEDPELSYRMAEKGLKMVFNPNAIVFHQHPDSLQKYLRSKFFRAYWRVLLYGKHKAKALNDSYTPQLLKLQIFLSIAIVLSVFFGKIAFVSMILLFLLTTIGFFAFALKRDVAVAVVSPAILFLRSLVFFFGLVAGFFGGAAK